MRERKDVEMQVVVTSSALLDRYGSAIQVIEKDGYAITAKVYNVVEGEDLRSMSKTTGLGIIELSSVFDNIKPDVVVTIADRFETIATAIAAAYMNIALCHIQGGEVTGSIDEKVRHAITKLADLHLVATQLAGDRLIHMGEDPWRVHVTGCPSIDLAAEVLKDPALDFNPLERYGGVGSSVDLTDGYLVVLQHPVTTEYTESRKHVLETLHATHETDLPTCWFWPNMDAGSDGTSKGIRFFREEFHPANIHFFKNMEPHDFLKLIYNAKAVIGNSSVAIREASFLGVPAVNIGSRQAGRERGPNVVDVEYDRQAIKVAIHSLMTSERPPCSRTYGDGQAGERIAELLASLPLQIEKRLAY
jgi:UDP-hydrolysing UDP-N-acetyl-D-glucosamine 2-epimerase